MKQYEAKCNNIETIFSLLLNLGRTNFSGGVYSNNNKLIYILNFK